MSGGAILVLIGMIYAYPAWYFWGSGHLATERSLNLTMFKLKYQTKLKLFSIFRNFFKKFNLHIFYKIIKISYTKNGISYMDIIFVKK